MKGTFQFRLKIHDGTQYKFGLFGITIWISNHFSYAGWFRLFGIGVSWKHESLGLLFSQRNGYSKYIKIGKWVISYLPHK